VGLDVAAASHLRYVRKVPWGGSLDRLVEELAAQNKKLSDEYFVVAPNALRHRRRMGAMRSGLYAYTRKSRRYAFHIDSTPGYNWWLNQLGLFALGAKAEAVRKWPRTFRGRPFVELINFSDSDGRIGTDFSSKLAGDFTSHEARARRHARTLRTDDPEGWSGDEWLAVYRDFARAFRIAAQKGALSITSE
jgi:hypothetical protein